MLSAFTLFERYTPSARFIFSYLYQSEPERSSRARGLYRGSRRYVMRSSSSKSLVWRASRQLGTNRYRIGRYFSTFTPLLYIPKFVEAEQTRPESLSDLIYLCNLQQKPINKIAIAPLRALAHCCITSPVLDAQHPISTVPSCRKCSLSTVSSTWCSVFGIADWRWLERWVPHKALTVSELLHSRPRAKSGRNLKEGLTG